MRSSSVVLILAITSLVVSACQIVAGPPPVAEQCTEEDKIALVQAYADAYAVGDVAAAVNLFNEDGTMDTDYRLRFNPQTNRYESEGMVIRDTRHLEIEMRVDLLASIDHTIDIQEIEVDEDTLDVVSTGSGMSRIYEASLTNPTAGLGQIGRVNLPFDEVEIWHRIIVEDCKIQHMEWGFTEAALNALSEARPSDD